MKFEWQKIRDQPTFDTAIELLLETKWAGNETSFAPDGRGSDGGVDFRVEVDGELWIYQLKFHPDGFKSSTASRKRHVRESFETAIRTHQPARWILVVPAKLTVGERKTVMAMKAPDGLAKPAIHILDLPKLDAMLANHPKVRDYLDREPLLDSIEGRTIEQSEPLSIDEVKARAQSLMERAGHLDPHYDMDLSVRGGHVSVSPRPKYPAAAKKSPLGVELEIDPSAMAADVRAVFDRAMTYGTGETIRIPQQAITVLNQTGPHWDWWPDGDFELVQVLKEAPDAVVLLELFDENGTPLQSHETRATHIAPGSGGASIRASFYSGVSVQFLVPHRKGQQGSLTIDLDVHRLDTRDVRDALALNRVLHTQAEEIRLSIEGQRILRAQIEMRPTADLQDQEILEQFAGDFTTLLEHQGLRRTMPVEVSGFERALARIACLVLDGKTVLLPDSFRLNAVVDTGGDAQALEQFRTLASGPKAMIARRTEFTVEVAHVSFDIGPVAFYAPSATITDSKDVLEAITQGRFDGRQVSFAADPESGWRVASIPNIETIPSDWSASPWNAVGIAEHASLGPATRYVAGQAPS